MTQVTLQLGAPASNSSSTRVNWVNLDSGFGDASALSATSGSDRVPVRLQINTNGGRVIFRVVEVPDGIESGADQGQELSE